VITSRELYFQYKSSEARWPGELGSRASGVI